KGKLHNHPHWLLCGIGPPQRHSQLPFSALSVVLPASAWTMGVRTLAEPRTRSGGGLLLRRNPRRPGGVLLHGLHVRSAWPEGLAVGFVRCNGLQVVVEGAGPVVLPEPAVAEEKMPHGLPPFRPPVAVEQLAPECWIRIAVNVQATTGQCRVVGRILVEIDRKPAQRVKGPLPEPQKVVDGATKEHADFRWLSSYPIADGLSSAIAGVAQFRNHLGQDNVPAIPWREIAFDDFSGLSGV